MTPVRLLAISPGITTALAALFGSLASGSLKLDITALEPCSDPVHEASASF